MSLHIAKIIIYTATAFILTACASTKPIEISTAPVVNNIYQPAQPEPVTMSDVKFKVVTKATLDAFIAEQIKLQGNDNPVFVVIGIQDYQSLSLNLAELKRYIDQQKHIIIYYQNATSVKN